MNNYSLSTAVLKRLKITVVINLKIGSDLFSKKIWSLKANNSTDKAQR